MKKNFENRSVTDDDMDKSMLACFFSIHRVGLQFNDDDNDDDSGLCISLCVACLVIDGAT